MELKGMFMFIALFVSIVLGYNLQNNKVYSTPCGSLPPGYTYFTKGWDLSTIDLINLNDMNEKTTVLETTCNPNTPPFVNDYNNKTYMLPDQLAGPPVNVAADVTHAFELLVTDSQSFRENLAETISESAFFGLFSKSKSYYESASLLASEYVYTGIQSSYMAAYEMDLVESFVADRMNLTVSCQYLVDRLPPTFNDSTFDAYEQMINTCGTHYMKKAIFGCKFQYKHFTGTGKLDVMASGDVGLNAGLDFHSFLKDSGAISGTVSAASQNYLSITTNFTSCYGGGTACPTDVASFKEWETTCPNEPAFISGKFGSIGDLIRQSDVSASFKLATQNHFNRAFLKDELIPLFNLIIKVVNTPGLSISDTGGTCLTSGPAVCPGACVGSINCFCDGLPHAGVVCPNPVYGQTQADMDAIIHQVQSNITAWTTKIDSLITQAETALKSNIVPNSTITAIGVEFVYFVSNIQMPVTVGQCGWTFKQTNGCIGDWGQCQPTPPPAPNVAYRTITYIKGLF